MITDAVVGAFVISYGEGDVIVKYAGT
jgi:hypothetical protein